MSVKLLPATENGVLPEGFFVTSNRRTWIILNGKMIEVQNIRMDCCIVVQPDEEKAFCIEPRKVKKGELVVVGTEGVIEEGEFKFMTEPTSPERPAHLIIKELARLLLNVRKKKGRVFIVAGPAVIHAGGREALSELIRLGFVNVLIAGNGLAVHDIEASIYSTSLGVSLETGEYIDHRNHIWTINKIRAVGSIKEAVEKGIIKNGIMYECVKNKVKYILVGSIRDDGPLPDTIMDMIEAQDKIRDEILKGVDLVICLATALLTIGVCNMLPYWIKVFVIDINPAVGIKVKDRGSHQIVSVVTDVGLFLRNLVKIVRQYSD